MSAEPIPPSDIMSSTELRNHLGDVIGRAQHGGRITRITKGRNGVPVAAMVPVEFLDHALRALDAAEDSELGRMAVEAIEADGDDEPVSATELHRRLGL